MKNTTFILLTALLICIIGLCVVSTVEGQESGENSEFEAYYREVEAGLLEDVKVYLREQGFANSGVTLNRVVDVDGNREYTFTIHHSRIDKMDDEERQCLRQQLSGREVLVFSADTSIQYNICYDFLILPDGN